MLKKLVVLTGAGISAESGIKTFRDSDGLWENYRIEDVCTHDAWLHNTKVVIDFYNQRRKELYNTKPNAAHDEFGIATKKIYSGELCPDHCNVVVLDEAVEWAESTGSDYLFVETAGLCLRCSPYIENSLGIVVLEATSGMNLPRKIGPMPSGKKRKRHKMSTHKRKKRLRKNRHKKK